jgi:hypothetical protein
MSTESELLSNSIAAQTTQKHVELCESCTEFVEWIARPGLDDTSHSFIWLRRASWKACQFCNLFIRPRSNENPSDVAVALELFFTRYPSVIQDEKDLLCSGRLEGPISLEYEYFATDISFWADNGMVDSVFASISQPLIKVLGTPACERFVRRKSILGPDFTDMCTFTKVWLRDCQSFHSACDLGSLKGSPSRLLHIVSDLEAIVVKLVETKGAQNLEYCALSHCWGPAEKRPLCTTRGNYQNHLAGISLEQLPKTFRDTVLLAQGLDIEYVWIDSLCIVQDDRQDWEAEAIKMASVYKNAVLVVAASDAKDSTEGLFITDRAQEPVMVVPYIANGVVKGSFNILKMKSHNQDPKSSLLETRAWVFQERLLAKRLVYFTRDEVFWECTQSGVAEPCRRRYFGFLEHLSWTSLLESYCRRKLTNAEDRLYALRGVAEDMKRPHKGQYFHDYGVWEDDLPWQLLWQQSDAYHDSLDLPTWCWAATGGCKSWVQLSNDHRTNLDMKVTKHGSLTTVGHVTKAGFTPHLLSQDIWDYLDEIAHYSSNCEKFFLDGFIAGTTRVHILGDTSEIPQVQGIAKYDVAPSTSARCFFVLTSNRSPDNIDESALQTSETYKGRLEAEDRVGLNPWYKRMANTTRHRSSDT